jgi:hypothetical protein
MTSKKLAYVLEECLKNVRKEKGLDINPSD